MKKVSSKQITIVTNIWRKKKWREDNENSQRRLKKIRKKEDRTSCNKERAKDFDFVYVWSVFFSLLCQAIVFLIKPASHAKSDVTRSQCLTPQGLPCLTSQELHVWRHRGSHVCIKRAPSLTSQGLHVRITRAPTPDVTRTPCLTSQGLHVWRHKGSKSDVLRAPCLTSQGL